MKTTFELRARTRSAFFAAQYMAWVLMLSLATWQLPAVAASNDAPQTKPADVKAVVAQTPDVKAADAKPDAFQSVATKPSKTVKAEKTTTQSSGEVHLDRLLRVEEFKKYNKAEAHQIQQDLAVIYHDDPDFLRDVALGHKPLTDDIVGPVTLFWMQRYCYTFRVEPIGDFTDGLIASIASFAAFSGRHQEEKGILLSHDFGKWLQSLPAEKNKADYLIMRTGSDDARIALINDYPKRPVKQNTAKASNQIYSYRLDQADVDTLRYLQKIVIDLRTFPVKPFPTLAEFDAAVLAAVKDVPPDVVKKYLPQIEGVAKVGGYCITDQSITAMDDSGVPPDLVKAMGGDSLKNVLFESEADLLAAMKAAADDARQSTAFATYQSRLIAISALGTYILDLPALDKLVLVLSDNQQKPIIPLELDKILMQLVGVNYPTSDLFDKAAEAKIWYSFGACPKNTPDYASYLHSLMLKDEPFAALQKALVESIGAGDAKSLGEINARFADIVKLRQTEGVCTSDEDNKAKILAHEVYQYYRHSLASLVRKAAPDSEKPVSWSGGAWGVKDGIVTSSCGCVLNNLSGQIYSFYPFWLEPPVSADKTDADAASKAPADGTAKKPEAQPQVLDFNVSSRIGFVGFTFDDQGNLKTAPGRHDIDYSFVKVANNFQTKIDWVIRRDNWVGWAALSDVERKAGFVKLKKDILNLLNTTGGNGVTLFFESYPSFDNTSKSAGKDPFDAFYDFVTDLNTGLRATGKHYGLNVVLRQPQPLREDSPEHADAKANDYVNMLKLLDAMNPDEIGKKKWHTGSRLIDGIYGFVVPDPTPQSRNHILLLIEEPTTNSKKRLRLEMEQALHGEERHRLQSGVIPVIEFDGRNWEQLEDDIIYFKDNFDGIGFWPVNFHQPPGKLANDTASVDENHCNHGETVEQCLVKSYQGNNLNGRDDSAPDKFVCQYHDWFRILLFLQLSLALTAYLVPIFTCRMRDWVQSHFQLLAINFALLVVNGLMLLAWDPALEGSNAQIFVWIALLLVIAFYGIRRRMEFVARTVKPSRAKSALLEQSKASSDDEDDDKPQKRQSNEKITQQMTARRKSVLKAVLRLRIWLEKGAAATLDQRKNLMNDLTTLTDFLEVEEYESITTRAKIRKANQIVLDHLDVPDDKAIAPQKMRRLAILLWSYLNDSVAAEQQVLQQLEPFLELFEEGTALDRAARVKFGNILQESHVCLLQRESSEAHNFAAMKSATDQMRLNLTQEPAPSTATYEAMQVVWTFVDHDESLHNRAQIENDASANPAQAIELSNARPIIP